MNRLYPIFNLPLPKALSVIIPLLILVGACGGPLAQNQLLVDARANYMAAEQDASIVQLAPVELKEAEEALEMSNKLWTAKADKTDIEHYAYLANQKISIARETSLLKTAQNEIERGEFERQQVLLDGRQADADRSERRATAALSEAQRSEQRASDARSEAQRERDSATEARASADEARIRAEELAKRVNELEARPTDRGLVLTLGDVLFDFGNATLRSGGMQTVNQLANFLNEYPERNILIEGFTDNVGSADFNQELSTRRADGVKNALINQGIAANRIRIRGYGLNYPVANNATAEGRNQNRRVEVVISNQDGTINDRSN